jgi:hypothetical protein
LTSTSSSVWQTFADLLDPPENLYVRDPVGWVRDRLGEFMWSKQCEIAEALVEHRYVAVKSAHDTGKSHVASRIVAWHVDTQSDPFATTTAPTTKQVHAILWRYLGQAHRKAKLAGRITLDDEWYTGPGGKELVAYGRKPADTDQAAFQGIHTLHPFVLVDEACGVPKSIFDAVDSLATNENARVLAIGNPMTPPVTLLRSANPARDGTSSLCRPSIRLPIRVRRFPKSCCHCSYHRSGLRNGSSAGVSPARSTSRKSWASSPISRTTRDLAEVD